MKILRTTVDDFFWRPQQIGQNKTKSRDSRLKVTTRAEDNFIRVANLRDRRLTAPDIIEQLNPCHENMSTSTVRRRLCEAGLYGRIAVKKPLLRKQYIKSKGSSGPRHTKTGRTQSVWAV